MNATVYLFGKFNSGYTQYPDDHTSGIFHKFYENAKSATQIVIHRDNDLMYYGYIRRLEQNRYIGLCIVLNGLLLTHIDGLFSLFENTISGLVTNGRLIHFNEQGDIVTSVENLYMNKEDVDMLCESLRAGFSRFESSIVTLPAVSYGVSKDSVKDFVIDDDKTEIVTSSHTNGYTFIYKSKSYNTALMNSYKGVLTRVNNEKKSIQKELDILKIEHTRVLRQKKQFKYIMILFAVLLGCAIGLFSLYDNLNTTRYALSNANDTINKQNNALSNANDTINKQNDAITNQSMQITNLYRANTELERNRQAEETLRIEAENNLETLKQIISERQPFFIRKTTFNFRTGYLRFDYYGLTNEKVAINVHVYNADKVALTIRANVQIKTGDNSASIYIDDKLNSTKWYSFEIVKGNVILGGDRH